MANNYFTKETFKAILNIETASHDEIIDYHIKVASRLIDNWFGYPDGYWAAEDVETTRNVKGGGNQTLWLDGLLLRLIRVMDGTTEIATKDYNGIPITSLYKSSGVWENKYYAVTGVWGAEFTPPTLIEHACFTQTVHLYNATQTGLQAEGVATADAVTLHPTVIQLLELVGSQFFGGLA